MARGCGRREGQTGSLCTCLGLPVCVYKQVNINGRTCLCLQCLQILSAIAGFVNEQTPQWRFSCDGIGDQHTSIRDTRIREHDMRWPPIRVAKYFATPKPIEIPTHTAPHLVWFFFFFNSVFWLFNLVMRLFLAPLRCAVSKGKIRIHPECAIAPRTLRGKR